MIELNTAFNFHENQDLIFYAVLISYYLTEDTPEAIVSELLLLHEKS